MKRIDRSAIVEHSAAQIFALVEDIEAYPRFLPWCVAATVDERGPAGTRATLTVGVRGLRQSFTTLNRSHPGEAIDLSLVQGPFRRFAAAWRFTPLSERASRIEFSLEYDFSSRALEKSYSSENSILEARVFAGVRFLQPGAGEAAGAIV